MRAFILTLTLAFLPLLLGFWVNYSAPHKPSRKYEASHCTRYCEVHGCPHATAANSPAFWRLRPLYVLTIQALAVGGSDLYGALNILFYIIFVPGALLWLTYGALRNGRHIRNLKRQLRA